MKVSICKPRTMGDLEVHCRKAQQSSCPKLRNGKATGSTGPSPSTAASSISSLILRGHLQIGTPIQPAIPADFDFPVLAHHSGLAEMS